MSLPNINNYTYTPGFIPGQYHNIVLCVSGNIQSLYLNGSLIATQTSASNLLANYSTINQLTMGCAGDRSNGFTGYLDDFRIYNYVFNQTQVSNLYVNRNLITHYPFDNSLNGLTPNYATLSYDGRLVGNVIIDTSASNINIGSGALRLNNNSGVSSYIHSTSGFSTSYTSGISISLWFKTTGVSNKKMCLLDLCTSAGIPGFSVNISGTDIMNTTFNGYTRTKLQTTIQIVTEFSRYLWLDASSSSNFTFSSGNNISQWNGSNGSYSTSSITATWVSSSPNSYVNYNTTAFNFAASNYYSTSSKETCFIVFSTPSVVDSNFNFICLGGGTNTSGYVGRILSIRQNNIAIPNNNVGSGYGFQGYLPYDLSSNTTYVVSFTMDYTDSTFSKTIVRLNGINISPMGGLTFSFNQNNSAVETNIGSVYSPFNGSAPIVYINEIIGINNCLMELYDIQSIESYLVDKWANINYLNIRQISTTSIIDTLTSTTKSAMLYSGTGATLSAGAYGTKLLYAAYKDPVMTIRRSSDSFFYNFYADTSGNLGTGYLATGTLLTTWLSGAYAYVTKWWDQTGNGNHAIQTTAILQPIYNSVNKYVDFGTTTTGGRVNTYFSLQNGAYPYGNSAYSYIFKQGTYVPDTNGNVLYFGGDYTQNGKGFTIYIPTDKTIRSIWQNIDVSTPVISNLSNAVISDLYNGTNSSGRNIYVNAVSKVLTGGNTSVRNQPSTNNYLGYDPVSSGIYFNMPLYYLYYMPIAISNTDRAILEDYVYPSSILDSLSSTTKSNMINTTTTLSAGAYGTKLLYGGWQDAVMTIRRSSDSVTSLFYADTSGNLGTGYLATGTLLTTWLNGAYAYITKWWDQTGNGNHATQTTASLQPIYDLINKYVDFGTTTTGGRANAYFNLPDKTFPYGNSSYTYVFKHGIIDTQSTTRTVYTGGSIWHFGLMDYFTINSDKTYTDAWMITNYITQNKCAQNNSIVTNKYDNIGRYIYVNGISQPFVPVPGYVAYTRNQDSGTNKIGAFIDNAQTSNFFNSQLYYMYVAPIAISDTDRIILEST